ncbi:hypothetical protein V9T40_001494 [Parthenolecanium corni]|uniref:Uncharacterized protein n=1 Tax=Parthenolecanium corni TaxID=536013 RepID=A0AAN9TMD9_9HEMI
MSDKRPTNKKVNDDILDQKEKKQIKAEPRTASPTTAFNEPAVSQVEVATTSHPCLERRATTGDQPRRVDVEGKLVGPRKKVIPKIDKPSIVSEKRPSVETLHIDSTRDDKIFHKTEVLDGQLLQTFVQPHQRCGHELTPNEVAGIAERVLKKHREMSVSYQAGFERSRAVIAKTKEMVKKINETAEQLTEECTSEKKGEALLHGVQLDELIRKFEDTMLFRNSKSERSSTSSSSPDNQPKSNPNVEHIFTGRRKSCEPDPKPLPSICKKKTESVQDDKKKRTSNIPLPGEMDETPTGVPRYPNIDSFIDHTLRRRAIQVNASTQRESSEDRRNRLVQRDAETKRNTPDEVIEEETVKRFSHLNYLELRNVRLKVASKREEIKSRIKDLKKAQAALYVSKTQFRKLSVELDVLKFLESNKLHIDRVLREIEEDADEFIHYWNERLSSSSSNDSDRYDDFSGGNSNTLCV